MSGVLNADGSITVDLQPPSVVNLGQGVTGVQFLNPSGQVIASSAPAATGSIADVSRPTPRAAPVILTDLGKVTQLAANYLNYNPQTPAAPPNAAITYSNQQSGIMDQLQAMEAAIAALANHSQASTQLPSGIGSAGAASADLFVQKVQQLEAQHPLVAKALAALLGGSAVIGGVSLFKGHRGKKSRKVRRGAHISKSFRKSSSRYRHRPLSSLRKRRVHKRYSVHSGKRNRRLSRAHLVKGSRAARMHMARLRKMRKGG